MARTSPCLRHRLANAAYMWHVLCVQTCRILASRNGWFSREKRFPSPSHETMLTVLKLLLSLKHIFNKNIQKYIHKSTMNEDVSPIGKGWFPPCKSCIWVFPKIGILAPKKDGVQIMVNQTLCFNGWFGGFSHIGNTHIQQTVYSGTTKPPT